MAPPPQKNRRLARDNERRQKELFDVFVAKYEEHYNDDYTRAYKNGYICPWLMGDLPLKGARALEAMCGNGQAVEYLLGRGAKVTGLDISSTAMASFRQRWPQCRAVEASMLESGLPGGSFDLVVIFGGLHHLHPHMHDGVDQIWHLLKPGGWFCFVEPHAKSLWDLPRKLWYALDRRLFAPNEASIDIPGLEADHADQFRVIKRTYGGSLGYLLVLNAMIFRLPPRLKRFFARPLMKFEAYIQPRLGPRSACYVMSVWQKR